MKKSYRNIAILLGLLVMTACADDALQENGAFLPVNPDPDAEKLPANEQWAWVGAYPGEVNNSILRLENVEVKVNGNYEVRDLKLVSEPGYLQSSGLYVPPAERVTVNFPGGADNLYYQVGIASWDLPAGGQYLRYDKVSVKGKLEPGINTIFTNFGGSLYFYFEGTPQANELTLTVSGAVKSSDYVLNETNLEEWRESVTDPLNPMIWGELIGKRIILTLPLSALKRIERPDGLLKYYDEIIENDIEYFGGTTAEDFAMPWRMYSDVQVPTDADGKTLKVYPYYPMGYVSASADSLEKVVVNLTPTVENENDNVIIQGLIDLYSMVWNTSKYAGSYIRQLAAYRIFQRNGRWSEKVKTMTEPKVLADRYYLPTDNEKLSMVICLLQEYGWNLFTYAAKQSRTDNIPADVPDQYKNDLFAMYVSEYAGVDLTEFFEDWHFPISTYSRLYMKNYEKPADKFWTSVSATREPQVGDGPRGVAYEKNWPLQDTVYGRDSWIGTASSESGDKVANLIDGKINTQWQSNWQNNTPYPHEFNFTFEEPVAFNYVYMVQRLHNNPGPKQFRIQYKPSADPDVNDWVEIRNEEGKPKDFYLCRDYNADLGGPVQTIFLDETVESVYGVKIVLIKGLERTEGKGDVENYTSLAEFGIGLLK